MSLTSINDLISVITETHNFFQDQAQKQVNVVLTLRNWLFGFYISEYELHGADRAKYGKRIMKEIAQRAKHIKGFSESNLYLFKEFYHAYPQIFQSLTGKLQVKNFQSMKILQSATEKFKTEMSEQSSITSEHLRTESELLINRLSFTHIGRYKQKN